MAEDLITTIGNALYGSTENLRRLPRKAEELATETQRLKHLRDDLRSLAEYQARQTRGVMSNQLSGWMTRVEALVADADDLKTSFEDGSSSRLVTRYSLANNVVDLLQEAAKLIDQGNELLDRGLLLQPQQPDAVQHVPSEITSATLVDAEGPLQQIKSYIMDEGVRIIGIYGMGGVGKTTLLKVINNEFLTEEACRAKFDVAIWVTVSREAKNISSIQKTIASRLQIPLSDDLMHNHALFMELRKKRFILLLDDVWERLDLMDVGIPLPKHTENGSKILFTTRSEEVCGEMDVDEIVRVLPLDAESSWDLFCSKFGRKSLRGPDDPNIQPLAKQVVAKCGGLPISLITVGRAMAKSKTEDDWREAIDKLDYRPAELSQGMEKQVLQSLKFSFDQLRSKTLQDCLLYLTLFPEDWYILADEVIDYWICEGFLDSDVFDEPDIEDTRRRARSLITELQNACLLEAYDEGIYDGEFQREPCVRFHDTVRDMALWIVGYEFVALADSNYSISQAPKSEIWQMATRISLINNVPIKGWPSSSWNLRCPNLTALLLRDCSLGKNVPRDQALLTCSTTLLKVINNEFLTEEACRAKFDVAIWVTVSREAKDISSIQKTISSRLQIPLPDDLMHNHALFMELRKKKFILLLDDVWERLDLMEVGIPLPKHMENRSKILFTTRSEEVCGEMDVDEIVRVVPLDAERSWELFCSKLGRKSLRGPDDPNIQPLAKQVVAKCGGLPISLITVGRAMVKSKTEDDWREAIIKLDYRPAELSQGMEKQVLQSLRFSFDQLRSKTLQDCLLYLALFPEDWYILADDVIDYWICEGFLDTDVFDEPDIEDTRRRARSLITQLQNACLLEAYDEGIYDGEFQREPCVRLHDTIRDMALWIAGYEFVALTGSNHSASQVPKSEIWQMATRITLINNGPIKEWPSSSSNLYCPNLTALLLLDSAFGKNIPRDQALLTCSTMPALRVLDLSLADLTELPIGITSLTSLHFLSLKENKLTSLPVELGNLVNLRKLILRKNKNLQTIPREALIRLTSLQVLDMTRCACEFLRWSELDELRNLKRLSDVHLSCDKCSWEVLNVIAESPFLCRCIRELLVCDDPSPPPMGDVISQQICMLSKRIKRLDLCGDRDKPVRGELVLHSDQLQHLHVLRISCFTDAKISIVTPESYPLFPRLTYLDIDNCGCNDLKWISGLPYLLVLRLGNCGELTEILPDESCSDNRAPVLFPELQVITLFHLPQLRSISKRTLLLPFLKVLSVHKCSQLRRLPFRHVCNLEEFIGSKEWWDGLEWDNNNSDHDLIRERFSSKFSR